jgi:hypothetical protein
VCWATHAGLAHVRNATELLGPKIEMFLHGASHQAQGRYRLSVADNAILLEDVADGSRINVKIGNKNSDLSTFFEECALYRSAWSHSHTRACTFLYASQITGASRASRLLSSGLQRIS